MTSGVPRRLMNMLSAGVLLTLAAQATAGAPHTYVVVIEQMKFSPLPTELHQGDTLVWLNRDILRHSATAPNRAFDVDLPPGAAKRMLLTKRGTFAFVCRYHPGMRGTLVIR